MIARAACIAINLLLTVVLVACLVDSLISLRRRFLLLLARFCASAPAVVNPEQRPNGGQYSAKPLVDGDNPRLEIPHD